MYLLIFLSNFISLMFISSSSPISMVVLIMANALNLCMLIFISQKVSWFSFVLFLIFLGGLMVLFVYICSIASNEVNSFKMPYKHLLVNLLLSTMLCLGISEVILIMETSYIHSVSKLIMYSNYYLFLTTLVYLILTLFVSVVISKMKFGPVRAKKN